MGGAVRNLNRQGRQAHAKIDSDGRVGLGVFLGDLGGWALAKPIGSLVIALRRLPAAPRRPAGGPGIPRRGAGRRRKVRTWSGAVWNLNRQGRQAHATIDSDGRVGLGVFLGDLGGWALAKPIGSLVIALRRLPAAPRRPAGGPGIPRRGAGRRRKVRTWSGAVWNLNRQGRQAHATIDSDGRVGLGVFLGDLGGWALVKPIGSLVIALRRLPAVPRRPAGWPGH